MSLKQDHKPSRLIAQVEIEVTNELGKTYSAGRVGAPNSSSMDDCILELVECLEQLDGADKAARLSDAADPQKSALDAVAEMEDHIRRFQKQSATLKRLINKVH